MTAKELLMEPVIARQTLHSIRGRLEEIQADLFSMGGGIGNAGHGRQYDRSAHFERVCLKYAEQLDEYAENAGKLFEAQNAACEQIERLDDERYIDILFYRYVIGRSVPEIAAIMGLSSIKWVYDLSSAAQKELQKIMDDDERKNEKTWQVKDTSSENTEMDPGT